MTMRHAALSTLIELPSQHHLLDRLETLIRFESQIILVHGEPGSGKTTIAENLLEQVDFANQAWLSIESDSSDEYLRERLLKQWINDPLFNAEDPLFESLSRNMDVSVAPLLLIVDQAENLSETFFNDLFELVKKYSHNYRHALNIVLFSSLTSKQFARENNLSIPELLVLEVEVLDREEANVLVSELFELFDYQASVANREVIEQRIDTALGNPRSISLMVEQIISGAANMADEPKNQGKRKPYALWGGIAVLIAAVAGLLVQVLNHPSDHQTPANEQVSTGQPHVNIPVVLPTKKDEQQAASKTTGKTSPAGATEDNTATLPKPITEKTISKQDAPEIGQKRVVVDDAVVNELLKAQQKDDDKMVQNEKGEEPASQSESASDAQHQTSDKVQMTMNTKSSAPTKAVTSSEQTKMVSKESTVNHPEQDTESVLNAKPSRHYTLQLGAFSSLQAAQEFVRKTSHSSEAWVYPFQGSTRILYKVIRGDYATRAEALKQQRALKAKGQASLLKSFKQVQFELKQQ